MCISLLFTLVIYQISVTELQRSLKGPITQKERQILVDERDINAVIEQRQELLDSAETRLRSGLAFLNAIIIIAGGGLSYALARRSLEPIERAHEVQSRFTADASHELRTPITAMRIETELTLTEPKLTLKEAKKQLESNIEELDKLTSLSEGLLQLARLDESNLEKEQVQVAIVVQKAISRIQKKTQEKKQTVTTKKLNDCQIEANEVALVEALVTLLDNACKYSPEESEIRVACRALPKTIEISISDQGIGILPTEKEQVFERFYRADNSRTKTAEPGYGIGLSIAKAVAEAHNGKIKVESTPKKGSTFTLSLPR
jgi:signal transduction histidine kinase